LTVEAVAIFSSSKGLICIFHGLLYVEDLGSGCSIGVKRDGPFEVLLPSQRGLQSVWILGRALLINKLHAWFVSVCKLKITIK
jgi:hypothetical protein